MTTHEVWVVSEKRDNAWQEHSRWSQETVAEINASHLRKDDEHVTETRVFLLRIIRENN